MSLRTIAFLWILLPFSERRLMAQDTQQVKQDTDWYESFFQANQRSFEEIVAICNSNLEEAKETQDAPAQAHALKELGLIHLTRSSDYEQALDFLVKSLSIEDSLGLKANQVFTFLAIAQVFEEVGDYYKSGQFLEQALRLNEQARNVNVLALILNKLGKINASLGKIEEAFENYELVLEYKEEIGKPKIEAEALFNLAHLHTLQGKHTTALDLHKRALSLRRSAKDKKGEAKSLSDIGELYRLMKNNERALANHVAALEVRQNSRDEKGIGESYNYIGALYYDQKNFERAIANLQLALQAAQESQSREQIRKSYEYLSHCYKELGDYKKALENKELFLAINDFIQQERNDRQLLETQNRYTLNKKESQIAKLEADQAQREKELQAQKKIRNFLFLLVGLGVVIVVLVFYLYILKQRSHKVLQEANEKVQRQNVELQNLNATKDKFFSIISHDLKGPLNSLTSFSGLLINHTDSLSKEEIQMLAKDLDKSIKNLFVLLENLLEWSRSQTGSIEFKPEPFDLGALLDENKTLLQIQAQNKNISIASKHTGNLSVHAHKHSVNTVIRNLISNAIKFTPADGTITLDAHQNRAEVVVSIRDTGVGMEPEVIAKLFKIDTKHSTKGTANEKGTGLGLILCKDFVEKNGGRIWVESKVGQGSVFTFTLPANGSRGD